MVEATAPQTGLSLTNLFNKYFHSVNHDPSIVPNVNELPDIPGSLQAIDITISDVYEALVSLDIDKSLGKDEISPRVLQSCADRVTLCSTSLFIYYVIKICFDTFQVEDSQGHSSI